MTLTDEQVDRMLSAAIPGGSQARDWFLPHEQPRGLANVRDVVRAMFALLPQETAASRATRMLSECKEEDLAGQHHALVYGRVRVWHNSLKDTNELESHWSRYAWWKAMWYPHRGSPSDSGAWGVYGGSDGYTGPGDANLSHYEPLPPPPLAAADEGMPK